MDHVQWRSQCMASYLLIVSRLHRLLARYADTVSKWCLLSEPVDLECYCSRPDIHFEILHNHITDSAELGCSVECALARSNLALSSVGSYMPIAEVLTIGPEVVEKSWNTRERYRGETIGCP